MNASEYSIELRDKSGNLNTYLTPFVSKVNWEWNRLGGCGRCSITINKAYRDIVFDARGDIQIRVKNLDKNLLTNSNFEDWSAGAAAAPDEWTLSGASATIAREATIVRSGIYSAKLTRVGADCVIYARIDSICGLSYWKGKKVTLGCWVYATVADRVRITLDQTGTGTTYSSYHTGDSTWQFLTVTTTIGETTTAFYANLQVDTGNTSAYFDDAICVEGESIAEATIVPRSKLVYRGYIANIVPTFKTNQDIVLDVRGYFDLLKKIVVHTTGDTRTYTTDEISVIVTDIIDTFVTPNSPITKGTIDAGTFECDSIEFLSTVDDALRTLAELTGDVEYGVDEDLVFFWRTESTTIKNKFFAGDNVITLERRIEWDELMNKLYLVGGDVAGVKYKRTAEDTDSQAQYYLSEKIVNNSSIVTDTVADQYLGAMLAEKANPALNIRAKIVNTDIRIEDTVPLGVITFYDAKYDRDSEGDLIGDIIGEAADGGSDITVGLLADGGSDVTIGGQFGSQIDRISYSLSNTPGKFNIEIQLGDTILETAAKIKKLELAINSLQQY